MAGQRTRLLGCYGKALARLAGAPPAAEGRGRETGGAGLEGRGWLPEPLRIPEAKREPVVQALNVEQVDGG